MINKLLIVKQSRVFIEVLCQYLPGGTEENEETPQSG
jgi:hypothetical protein